MDESGNSGTNLFDGAQPDFWTGTLLAPPDFENGAVETVGRCCNLIGAKELHGNALGLGRICQIAPAIIALFRSARTRFIFTYVNKKHLAATKFADTVLDNGTNQAMSLVQYGPAAARLPLALQLIQLLDDSDLAEWWAAYMGNDPTGFVRVMERPRPTA